MQAFDAGIEVGGIVDLRAVQRQDHVADFEAGVFRRRAGLCLAHLGRVARSSQACRLPLSSRPRARHRDSRGLSGPTAAPPSPAANTLSISNQPSSLSPGAGPRRYHGAALNAASGNDRHNQGSTLPANKGAALLPGACQTNTHLRRAVRQPTLALRRNRRAARSAQLGFCLCPPGQPTQRGPQQH